MKITKYDVHVHAADDQLHEIVGKYFICADDSFNTIKTAIARSTDKTFAKYLNDERYAIHLVSGEELAEEEITLFQKLIKTDSDPENFFISYNK